MFEFDFDGLKSKATEIKVEIRNFFNSAARVGGLLENIVDYLREMRGEQASIVDATREEIAQLGRKTLIPLGLLNPNDVISDKQKQVASAILDIKIIAKDVTGDYRVCGMWNSDANPQTCMVVKNYTTGEVCILEKSSPGAYNDIRFLSADSLQGTFSVSVSLDFSKIPWGFDWYEDNTERSLKFKPFSENLSNYWEGKKIAWFGTSIPAGTPGNNYPAMVADILRCTVWNEGIGSSAVRASRYDGSWKGGYFWPLALSLSGQPEEKERIIDYFSSGLDADGNITPGGTFGWKDLMPYAPDSLTEADKSLIRNSSYMEVLYKKHILNYVNVPDLWIIDHGWNDLNQEIGVYDNNEETAIAVPSVRNDRSYYIGAMNFIIDTILYAFPRARIVFISHYENQKVAKVVKAQENLAQYWEFPICRLYERLGWSQNVVIPTGLTMTQTWMPDGLHPHSDTTGAANRLIAETIAEWLKTIR